MSSPPRRSVGDGHTLAYPFPEQWRPSLGLAVRTGSIFSQGFPLTTEEQANNTGQVYPGKAVVIICYNSGSLIRTPPSRPCPAARR